VDTRMSKHRMRSHKRQSRVAAYRRLVSSLPAKAA